MLTRDAFEAFYKCVSDLHLRWNQYSALYRDDTVKAQVELLNEVAPLFFILDRDVWLDGIFLSISRLTDKEKVAGKRTLGLRSVFNLLDSGLKVQLD